MQPIWALNLVFFGIEMTNVEFASDVVHLNNIEQWKSFPPITLDWEAKNL